MTEPHGPPDAIVLATNGMFRPNGITSVVAALAREFRRRGIPTWILANDSGDPEFRNDDCFFVGRPFRRWTDEAQHFDRTRPVLKIPRRMLGLVWKPWNRRRVLRFIRGMPPRTLWIGAGLETLEWLAAHAPLRGVTVGQIHSAVGSLTDFQWDLVRRCERVSHAMAVFTERDAMALEAAGFRRGVVVPNPVERPQTTGRPDTSTRAVFVGRLAPEKQVDHLVRAFLAARQEPWTLHLYGSVAESELPPEVDGTVVVHHGAVQDTGPVYDSAAMHVMSSAFEGLPMTALEASAHGIPTVAYDCSPGMREAVGSGGVLVPPQDERALATAIGNLMQAPEERRWRGDMVKAHAESFFAPAVGERWLRLWSTLESDAK